MLNFQNNMKNAKIFINKFKLRLFWFWFWYNWPYIWIRMRLKILFHRWSCQEYRTGLHSFINLTFIVNMSVNCELTFKLNSFTSTSLPFVPQTFDINFVYYFPIQDAKCFNLPSQNLMVWSPNEFPYVLWDVGSSKISLNRRHI